MRCPYCGAEGTDHEVDEHRAIPGIHDEEPQAGSNVVARPRSMDEQLEQEFPEETARFESSMDRLRFPDDHVIPENLQVEGD